MLWKRPHIQSLLLFFLFAFVWSWVWFFSIFLLNRDFNSLSGKILFGIGGIGPLLGGIITTYYSKTTEGIKEYWSRITNFRLIRWYWYIVILFLPFLLRFLGIIASDLFNTTSDGIQFLVPESSEYLSLFFILFIFLFGPVVEEPGWRGWLEDFFRIRLNGLQTGFIIGFIWGTWHLPMFYIPGTYQFEVGALSTDFWLWMVDIIGSAILYSWIYNNTQKSILAAILFHFAINYSGILLFSTSSIEIFAILFKYLFIGSLLFLPANLLLAAPKDSPTLRTPSNHSKIKSGTYGHNL